MSVLTDALSQALPQLYPQMMIDLATLIMKAIPATFPEAEVQGLGHRCSHPREAVFWSKRTDNASQRVFPLIYKNT